MLSLSIKLSSTCMQLFQKYSCIHFYKFCSSEYQPSFYLFFIHELDHTFINTFYIYNLMKAQENVPKFMKIQYNIEGLSQNMSKQISGLVHALNEPFIEIKKLRAYLAEGIPDQISVVRQYTWKVILGYLPRAQSKWQQQIDKQQRIYGDFIKQYLPQAKYQNYPLIMTKTHPKWKEYEEDYYLWEQIQKDTCRTQSDLSFFSQDALQILIPFANSARKERYKMIHGEGPQVLKFWLSSKEEQKKTYRYDYMSRILFIYAKLNSRAGYVQGMNEVLAPIFYLVNKGKKGAIDEAACFFMFNNVMTDLIELNIEAFDKRENGIHGRIQQINKLLLATEPKIWQRMQELKIDPILYCFRWLTLLFAQQFELFETQRIWESIFSFEDRAIFVNCFAVTLISFSKQTIMKEEYSKVLTHLKRIRQHVSLAKVLFRASEMYHELRGADINGIAQRNFQNLNKKEKQSKLLVKTKSLINIFKNIL